VASRVATVLMPSKETARAVPVGRARSRIDEVR